MQRFFRLIASTAVALITACGSSDPQGENPNDAGVTDPILVPSSTSGGQATALEELVDAFA